MSAVGGVEPTSSIIDYQGRIPPPSTVDSPIVISLHNNVFHSGGLCDRLRAMCATYQICKEQGLKYKIAHFVPFNLRDFLEPNAVDWYISESDIIWDTRLVEILYWEPIPRKFTRRKTWDEYHNFNFNQFRKELSNVRNKKQIHVYHNLQCIRMEKVNGLFHELFRPTEELRRAIEWNKKQIGGKYVSVTARFQNLIGDFYEGDFKTLETEGEKRDYLQRCIRKVEEIHLRYPDMKVLVTSDSSRFLDEAGRLPYVHVNPGKVVHMQFTTDAAHEVYLKSFVDLFTIADAEKVHQLATGRMYIGGFPITAASINSRPYELIEF